MLTLFLWLIWLKKMWFAKHCRELLSVWYPQKPFLRTILIVQCIIANFKKKIVGDYILHFANNIIFHRKKVNWKVLTMISTKANPMFHILISNVKFYICRCLYKLYKTKRNSYFYRTTNVSKKLFLIRKIIM